MEPNKTPRTMLEAVKTYGNLDAALAEASDSRWPKGVICPHCQAERPMFLKTRRIWKCSVCRKQFSFKAGTVMEDSPIGLDKWLPAIWMIAGAKNGISSWELHRALGVTQKTAWFMLHRIRLAMQDETKGGKLGGHVEVDETFIGGKARNMHKSKRAKVLKRGPSGKAIVVGVLERGGEVRAQMVENRERQAVQSIVRENVELGSDLYTDEWSAYFGLSPEYAHQIINHADAYVEGKVHTNGLENFWSL